jgi:hypothetical protein
MKERTLVKKQAELLIEPDGRVISSRVGTYQDKIVVDLVKKFPRRLFTPRDIAKVQYGTNRPSPTNETYVRRKLSRAIANLQSQDIPCYPLYETTGRHRIKAIKVFVGDEEDLIAWPTYLERAKARKEISDERYHHLKTLAGKVTE